jgi:hypothetical protein
MEQLFLAIEICQTPLIFEARNIFSDTFGEIRIAVAKNYIIYIIIIIISYCFFAKKGHYTLID